MKKEKIPSDAGEALEKYKNWYFLQPKLIKIAILPFITGLCFFIISNDSIDTFSDYFLATIFIITLAANLYNQYLDNLINEDVNLIRREKEHWKYLTKNLIFLNQTLKGLIDSKSEMFVDAINKKSESSIKDAISYIKEKNSLKNNVSRIVEVLHNIFEKYTDELVKVRVSYLVPDDHDNKLVTKSWCNNDNEPPYSWDHDLKNDKFSKNGTTVAGSLWAMSDKTEILIDDIESHINGNEGKSLFTYTHDSQRERIKSIYCFKVIDPKDHTFLGILCVDSDTKDVFSGKREFFKIVFDCLARRIVYETRFAAMKKALNP